MHLQINIKRHFLFVFFKLEVNHKWYIVFPHTPNTFRRIFADNCQLSFCARSNPHSTSSNKQSFFWCDRGKYHEQQEVKDFGTGTKGGDGQIVEIFFLRRVSVSVFNFSSKVAHYCVTHCFFFLSSLLLPQSIDHTWLKRSSAAGMDYKAWGDFPRKVWYFITDSRRDRKKSQNKITLLGNTLCHFYLHCFLFLVGPHNSQLRLTTN